MTVSHAPGSPVERSPAGGLADVVELILDKGLVIDAFVRVSLVGIELITIDARVVVASVDTYLGYAQAVDRLDLAEKGGHGLPEILQGVAEPGGSRDTAKDTTKKVLGEAKEAFGEKLADRREEAREHRAGPRGEREP